jgi:hypothetical protein
MRKLDPATVKAVELTAPGACLVDREALRNQLRRGKIFGTFSEQDREAIWIAILSVSSNCLIPSLSSFFKDVNYLQGPVNCVRMLVDPSSKETLPFALKMAYTAINQTTGECIIQQSKNRFGSQSGNRLACIDLGYRQIWISAFRNWVEMPALPQKEKNRLAKPGSKRSADAVFGFAALAFRLGFESTRIKDLMQQSRDRDIARNAFLEARGLGHCQNDPAIFDGFLSMYEQATTIEAEHATNAKGPGKIPKRGGTPRIVDYEAEKSALFLDRMSAIVQESGEITPFFIRKSVYIAFFNGHTEELQYKAEQAAWKAGSINQAAQYQKDTEFKTNEHEQERFIQRFKQDRPEEGRQRERFDHKQREDEDCQRQLDEDMLEPSEEGNVEETINLGEQEDLQRKKEERLERGKKRSRKREKKERFKREIEMLKQEKESLEREKENFEREKKERLEPDRCGQEMQLERYNSNQDPYNEENSRQASNPGEEEMELERYNSSQDMYDEENSGGGFNVGGQEQDRLELERFGQEMKLERYNPNQDMNEPLDVENTGLAFNLGDQERLTAEAAAKQRQKGEIDILEEIRKQKEGKQKKKKKEEKLRTIKKKVLRIAAEERSRQEKELIKRVEQTKDRVIQERIKREKAEWARVEQERVEQEDKERLQWEETERIAREENAKAARETERVARETERVAREEEKRIVREENAKAAQEEKEMAARERVAQERSDEEERTQEDRQRQSDEDMFQLSHEEEETMRFEWDDNEDREKMNTEQKKEEFEKEKLEEEQRKQEKEKLEEEKAQQEKEKLEEEQRKQEEHRKQEKEKLEEEQRKQEKEKLEEEQRKQEEHRKQEKEKLEEEHRKQEKEKLEEEQRKQEEHRKQEKEKLEEKQRKQEEHRKQEKEKLEEEHRKQEKEKLEEEHRKQEKEKLEEEHRKQEKEKLEEEQRKQEKEESNKKLAKRQKESELQKPKRDSEASVEQATIQLEIKVQDGEIFDPDNLKVNQTVSVDPSKIWQLRRFVTKYMSKGYVPYDTKHRQLQLEDLRKVIEDGTNTIIMTSSRDPIEEGTKRARH